MGKARKIKAGAVLGDKYRIERPLEKGGMGTVYKAVHTGLDKTVAVKVLHPSMTENRRLVSRFVQEAKMIAMVQHPNIVDVLDVGYTSDGTPFFVMEFLNGESLKAYMKKGSVMQLGEILKVMKDTLTGLSFAHDKGIIHRDMKPGNIFIADMPHEVKVAKILDFGISKLLSPESKDSDREATLTGGFLGTPAYMSLEQASGKFGEVDIRSDLYSCGVIMYKMITGMTPFRGDTFVEVLHNVIHAPVPPPSFLRTSIPESVDAIVMKAMERNKDDRYQDCREFLNAVERFAASGKERSVDTADGEFDMSAEFAGSSDTPVDISITESELGAASAGKAFPGHGAPGAAQAKKMGWSITAEGKRAPSSARKAASWKKRLPLIIVLAASAVILPILVISIIKASSGPESAGIVPDPSALSNPSPPPETPPEAGRSAEEAGEPRKVTITFTGFPKGSEIFVNDEPKRNPLILEQGMKPADIVVRKDGKELLHKIITPGNDMELLYTVEQVVEGARTGTAGKTGKKKSGRKVRKKKKKEEDKEKPTIFKDLMI